MKLMDKKEFVEMQKDRDHIEATAISEPHNWSRETAKVMSKNIKSMNAFKIFNIGKKAISKYRDNTRNEKVY